MGLFDFFKTKQEKERDELIQKIQKNIFPGGSKQIEKEIREVRELLEFKYSYDQVKSTFIHAATMYHLSESKSKESIVKSILYNNNSVVTNNEATKIYNFLNTKNAPKNVIESFVRKVNSMEDHSRLFLISKGAIVEIKPFYNLTDLNKFEIIIFNSIEVLNGYEKNHPNKHSSVQNLYFNELIKQAVNYNIQMDKNTLIDYINCKLKFYFEELMKLTSESHYMPLKLYSSIIEHPLKKEPNASNDLVKSVQFYSHIGIMTDWVRKAVNKV